MAKQIRKFGLILVIALLAGILADAVYWYIRPDTVAYQSDGRETVIPADQIRATKCTRENGVLVPTGDYMQILMAKQDHPVRSIIVRFLYPIEEETTTRFYYKGAGEKKFDGKKKFFSQFAQGLTEDVITFPEGDWQDFRLDVMSKPLPLKEVVLCETVAVQRRLPYQMDYIRVLCVFAGLSAIAGLFQIKAFQRFASLTDRKLLAPDTRILPVNLVFCLFALAVMLHYIHSTIYFKKSVEEVKLFGTYFIVFGAVGFLLGKIWKDRGFRLMAALLVFNYLRACVPAYADMNDVRHKFVLGFYLIFGCYAVGSALRPDIRRKFLKAFCSLWTLAATALCALGLWVAWTGNPILLPGKENIRIVYGRLYLAYYSVSGGVLASVSIAVALTGFHLMEHKFPKVMYLLAVPVILVAGILTSTRTNYVLTAFVLGLTATLAVYRMLKPEKKNGRYRLRLIKWPVVIVFFLAVTFCIALAAPYVIDGYNATREKLKLSSAAAEEQDDLSAYSGERQAKNQRKIEKRTYSAGGGIVSLTGRVDIWKALYQYIQDDPIILLWGQSVKINMSGIYKYLTFHPGHVHNTLLQTLLESGIPGLILYICFLLYFCLRAFRVATDVDLPFWQRMIPVPVLTCMLGELVDTTTHIGTRCPQVTIMYLFAGMTVAMSHMGSRNPGIQAETDKEAREETPVAADETGRNRRRYRAVIVPESGIPEKPAGTEQDGTPDFPGETTQRRRRRRTGDAPESEEGNGTV